MAEPILASANFHVTADDIAASYRANLRWRARRPAFLGMMALVAAAVALVLALQTAGPPATRAIVAGAGLVGGLVTATLVHLLLYAAAPVLARRTIAGQKNLRHEWRVELTREGLRAITPAQNLFTAWSEYAGWSEDARVILVYQSDRLYQYIPRAPRAPISWRCCAKGSPGYRGDDTFCRPGLQCRPKTSRTLATRSASGTGLCAFWRSSR